MSKQETLQVLSARLVGPHSLLLGFSDGVTRRVNLLPHLKDTRWMRPLRDPAYFAKFKQDECSGTPEWQNGVAFDPEFLRELPEEVAPTGGPRARRLR